MTVAEINTHIETISDEFNSYIQYLDTISFTNDNQKEYSTSEIIILNVEKSTYNSIQYLEDLKNDSLREFRYILPQDSTILNLCFDFYNGITDKILDKFMIDNDFLAYNRTDIDPLDPVIPKGTEIIYYK